MDDTDLLSAPATGYGANTAPTSPSNPAPRAASAGFGDNHTFPRQPAAVIGGGSGAAGGSSRYAKPGIEGYAASGSAGAAGESGAEGDLQEMVSSGGAESGGDTAEASAEQLAAGENTAATATGDLSGIAGFERRTATEFGAESGGFGETGFLPEAGQATDGAGAEADAEFLPFLAAVVPTLLSAVGPSLAKAVVKRVSPTVRKVIAQAPRALAGPVATAFPKLPNGKGAIVQQLMRLLQQLGTKESGEEADGFESDAEAGVDQQLAAEVAAAMEVIIGADDRVRITNTTDAPWRHLCALRITFPSGAVYRGTGFFIGPRAVATAGHCVYLHNQGGWARSVEVIPAMNGGTRPYGTVRSSNLRSVSGWVTSKKPESDYGCIVLPPGSFNGAPGAFGFAALNATQLVAQPAVLAGYPGDKPFAEMWGMARRIRTVGDKTLSYDIDTVGGQSGAPVYVKRSGRRYVVGIHNYGAASGNSATRITPAVYAVLNGWSAL